MTGPLPCVVDEPWAGLAAPDRLRVLLAPIDGDASGDVLRLIARALEGQAGFDLRQGSTRLPMRTAVMTPEAEALLTESGADLVIWGQLAEGGAAVMLRFAAGHASFDLTGHAWRFGREEAQAGDRAEFAAQLRALAVSIATPGLLRRNSLAATLLPPVLPVLRALASAPARGREVGSITVLLWITGVTLTVAGDAMRDKALNQEAVDVLRLAIDEVSRTGAPETWGALMNHLGNALRRLAQAGDATALNAAIDAYRLALSVRTRESAPHAWAATRASLGRALDLLGESGDDQALREAVDAFRDALAIRTRDRSEIDWATTQIDLSRTLLLLAAMGDDLLWDDALETARAARSVLPRMRAPLLWAMASLAEGNVLSLIATPDAYRDAVAAYRGALEELTAESEPLEWAAAQYSLAQALRALARQGDADALADAVAAHRSALLGYTREHTPSDWALTQEQLGDTLAEQGRRGEVNALRAAAAAYREALAVLTREQSIDEWLALQEKLGDVLHLIGTHGDSEALVGAATAYREMLQAYEPDGLGWAMIQYTLGTVLLTLGHHGDLEALRNAIDTFERAVSVFVRDPEEDESVARTERKLAEARQLIRRH